MKTGKMTMSAAGILVLAAFVSAAPLQTVAAAFAARASAAEPPFGRELVAPTRVVWTSASGVSRAENLLKPKLRQVPEASWVGARANDASCVLANGGAATDGAAPAVLLDFGRELHGGLRISVSARSAKNARVRVRFGESVAEAMSELGERGACNDHAIRDSEILLPKMGSREIGNTGFRFVRIDFVTPGELALESVLAVSVMRGDLPAVGAFKSSDERLNRVFDTAARTAALCCQDYVWDGIKRDRLVWAGDLHPETMTILSVFGAASVLRDSLDYMMALTDAETGWMNGSFPTYTLWWLRNCAEWYRFTGDANFLADRIDYVEKTFDHVATLVKDGEGWTSATVHGCFLDWPTHGDPVAERAGAQALALMTARDVAFLGREAGRTRLVEKAESVAAKLARLRPDPHGAKSSAALLALGGLRDAREMFAEVLGKGGHAGVSTFYGYYMVEAMCAAGESQRALDTVRDYWGAMLDVGATSFWEDFDLAWTNNCFRIDELPVAGKKDIHGDYGNYCYKGFRHSLCHGWSSGPAAWCINRVLGIRPLAPGCRRVEVKPFLGNLDWAEGAMALPTGEKVAVKVRKRADGSLATEVSAPAWVEVCR
jgi:alpha-L-rhamnosidase